MEFSVRVVRGDDWATLKELRLRALSTDPDAFGSTYEETAGRPDSHWQARAVESELGETSQWSVAVDGGGVWIGMALAALRDGEPALFGMWVAPEARGMGVAEALCDACAGWAASRGFAALALEVVESNARALAAYLRCGFVASGQAQERYGERVLTLMRMRREI